MFLLTCTIANADTIDSLEGTAANGNEMTLTGTFTAKAQAAPLIFDDFEDGVHGNDLSDSTSKLRWNDFRQDGAKYNNTQAYSGSLSAYNNPTFPTGDTDYREFASSWQEFTPTDIMYVSWMWRWTNSGSDSTVGKDLRIVSVESGGTYEHYSSSACNTNIQNYNDAYPVEGAGAMDPYMAFYYNQSERTSTHEVPGVAYNTWYRKEMAGKLSDAGVSNGSMYGAIDNVAFWDISSVLTRDTGMGAYQYDSVLLGLMCANIIDGAAYEVWNDDVYVDNTWQRVELGNNVIHDNCTLTEIQLPYAWSTTKIGITVRSNVFLEGSSAYLFVFDANGVPSAGKEVIIGGGTVVTAPVKNISGIKLPSNKCSFPNENVNLPN